jgi:hypothetical protein
LTSVEQAHLRLEAEAQRHRENGNYAAGHDYQRMANEFARLASMAEKLPPARKARRATERRRTGRT